AKKLRTWIDGARWTYNQAVNMHFYHRCQDFNIIKQNCLNDEYIEKNLHLHWLFDTPRAVQSYAIRQYKKAYQIQKKVCEARDYNRKKGQFSFLKHIVSLEKLPKVNNTVIITLDKLGRFYIHISVPLEDRESQTYYNGRTGVRTFATCYDPRGRDVEWGSGDFGRIFRLCKQCDKFKSDLATKKGGKYKRTSQIVVRSLLIPKFRTSDMVKRKNRKICSKTARAMLTWGHYSFREFMKHKSREYYNKNVIICSEEYISKTCGNCGFINNIKGAKRFSCSSCKISIDRGFNGAKYSQISFLVI
ncbi:12314_t:CDS:2, partial [Gigaspora margarita]